MSSCSRCEFIDGEDTSKYMDHIFELLGNSHMKTHSHASSPSTGIL